MAALLRRPMYSHCVRWARMWTERRSLNKSNTAVAASNGLASSTQCQTRWQSSQSAVAHDARSDVRTYASPLVDTFGRMHDYLRISVTERCNLRCTYCMPAEGVPLAPSADMLTGDEILRIADLFVRNGVSKIRLTGGEPLVRKDIVEIAQRLGQLPGLSTLAMTTNGIALKRHLPALRDAGLNALNISLDTLKQDKFEQISRRKGHRAVVETLHSVLDSGFPSVKVNVVVMKDVNDDEMVSFCNLTENFPLDVRFIEFMPFHGNRWHDSRFLSYADMLNKIARHYGAIQRANDGANDTCKHFRIPGFSGRIGFITSMTSKFCGTCNRLRITADGNIKACLFGSEEVSLRDALRNGATNAELADIISQAVAAKHFALGGKNDMYDLAEGENRSMIRIGG